MRKFMLIAFISLSLSACENRPRNNAEEKMLCGQWMTAGEKYNQERYHFKPDGTFTDMLDNGGMLRTAETWSANGTELSLRYKHKMLLSLSFTAHYRILTLNDSVLVLALGAYRNHPGRNMSFKKMKLGGKFITT